MTTGAMARYPNRSIRLPQRMSAAPCGPDVSSCDGSTLSPVDKPAAAEYIMIATSSSATAPAANAIAARVETLVRPGTFPGGGQPIRFKLRFRDIAGRAALRGPGRIFLLLVGRQQQHDHRAIRVFQDLPGRFQSVDPWQIDVHQHQVGVQLLARRDRGFPGLRLADHVEAVGGLDHRSRGFPKRRLIVDDQYSYCHKSRYRMTGFAGGKNGASTTGRRAPT